MKIILDAMSGDNAPEAMIEGAIDAKAEFKCDIILVGRERDIRGCLGEKELEFEIVDARDIITMDDDPTASVRMKKDSSMAVALRLLSEGAGDAVVSAGNTGALLTGATLLVKRVPGIRRAALAPVLPNGGRGVCLIDGGANIECTPEYLVQFAYMGAFYAKSVMGFEQPRIGLLNNGTEESKGMELQKAAHSLLKEAHAQGRINFIGNIEAKDVLSGVVDVVVTDGYTGNILLKAIEGTAMFLMSEMKKILKSKAEPAASQMADDIRSLRSLLDSSEIGGTALLGISKPVIKAHGSSNSRAIRSAVMQAISVADSNISADIEANIGHMKI